MNTPNWIHNSGKTMNTPNWIHNSGKKKNPRGVSKGKLKSRKQSLNHLKSKYKVK
jgi:hypothetical protein